MPGFNRTGSNGQGSMTGRKMGGCASNDYPENSMRFNAGRGRNKGGAFGIGGDCVCAKCGAKTSHRTGEKCTNLKCPECGHTMVREELLNK